MRSDFIDAVDRASEIKTMFDAFNCLKGLSARCGLPKFMLSNGGIDTDEISSSKLIGNWDGGLLCAYDDLELAVGSPVLEKLGKSNLPFSWNVVKINSDRKGKKKNQAIDLFTAFQMSDGVSVPVFDLHGRKSWITFAGDTFADQPGVTEHLFFSSVAVFQQICELGLSDNNAQDAPTLAGRELECLKWAAAGKTVYESAIILGLSPHTVSHYLNTGMKKLSAVNRVQAVAKAMRFGLID